MCAVLQPHCCGRAGQRRERQHAKNGGPPLLIEQYPGCAAAEPTADIEGEAQQPGHIFRLSTVAGTSIGRDYENDIVLDEPAVSGQHAKVKLDEVEKGRLQFFIQDLASENGTVVNGQKIIKHYLTENDRITLGRATLVFKIIDDTPGK